MKKENFPFELRVRIKSSSKTTIEDLKKGLTEVAATSDLLYSSIKLPIEKKRHTLLKSPHVNKKAREQFEICHRKTLVILKGSTFDSSLWKKVKMLEGKDASLKVRFVSLAKDDEIKRILSI